MIKHLENSDPYSSYPHGKRVLIIGGSGTIGKAFIKRYTNPEEDKGYQFYNMSRNENSQVELLREFPRVKNYIGSIEDEAAVFRVFEKVKPDIVIHAAAMKHIDIVEREPIEACRINIVGSLNVINASRKYEVPITVAISTDKACSSESVYGDTKHLMERCFMSANDNDGSRFAVCRFANVAGSSGSVLPFWLGLKEKGLPLKLTDPKMNRLMFTERQAVDLIHRTILFLSTYGGGFVGTGKMKKVNMLDLAELISDDIKIVGLRPGEKLDEDLISERELPYTYVTKSGLYMMISDEKNDEDSALKRLKEPYNSSTAEVMSKSEMEILINPEIENWEGAACDE